MLSDVSRDLSRSYLHSKVGVKYRDFKSGANVLLNHGCVGRIRDFGIVKCVKDQSSPAVSVTATCLQAIMYGTTY